MALPFDKKVVVGTMGLDVGVAFWISPELGLLALGGVIFLSIISRLSWVLTRRKREQVAFETEHSDPAVKARSNGLTFLFMAVEHSQKLMAIVWQVYV